MILETLPSIGYLSAVMMLFTFLVAITGMMFFGGKLRPPALPEIPRSNFDNFPLAMLTVFQILTGENWNEVLYNTMEATSPIALFYFVVITVVGNFMLLNMFLAILLSNYS